MNKRLAILSNIYDSFIFTGTKVADNHSFQVVSEVEKGDSFFTHWEYRNSQEIDNNDNQLPSQNDLTLCDFDAALYNGQPHPGYAPN
ncbi:hypothetical protein HCN44_002289 [Aphidius gifuensis]|uniref:Uncharacterized protein n=1 Tax=Aphidius gifuensis TaxID=684658 RepID=A0A834XZV6_APHGI|nr:hypothetical protein HCN44_002289 [Aphidius gifuensis]